ncbi:glucose/galactose MFS transporter [Sphingomonas sp. KR3-1]|uniref:glucose/galactose MFS transporter n=1 Tax=Sphingomonas sp. KR3-1 TaxID=3156611 RepID=UPI0032B3C187
MSQAAAPSRFAFASVTALFFGWGFICANNDPLLAAARRVFGLNYTQALLTQIASFAAFALLSLPAAALLARLGAVRTIWLALGGMAAGCVAMQGIRWLPDFAVVLAAIFVLASGVTVLQVAANPLAAALGPPERSHYRLTLAHSFNALGVVCGVHFGARFVLAGDVFRSTAPIRDAAERASGIAAMAGAYLVMALLLAVLAALILVARRPIAGAEIPQPGGSALAALRSRWALLGALGIALYVGAEVTIGSTLILYLSQPGTLALPLDAAGGYVANLYWGGALVGRFAGSWALRHIPAPRLLALAGLAAAVLCLASLILPGPASAWCLLAVGLCNSIMFPTIFALTLERSAAPTAATSGLLILAIGPGAALPLLAGGIADRAGLGWAFAVPALAYCYILAFALSSSGGRSASAAAA